MIAATAAQQTYRKVIIGKSGGPEMLQWVEDELPTLPSDYVRIKVEAAGVGYTDVMMREGAYPGAAKPPITPGSDVTGHVEAVGSAVQAHQIGDTVVALLTHNVGGYAQYVQLPAAQAFSAPAHVDAAIRVSLVLNYLTAYQMLHRIARVAADERVLIHGAAGGVGTALMQLCQHSDITAYGTASRLKHDVLAEYNVTAIDYHDEDFVARIHQLTDGGVDVVFDAIGGTHYRRSFAALRPGGKLIAYGFQQALKDGKRNLLGLLNGLVRQPRFSPLSLMPESKSVCGYGIFNRPDWHPDDLEALFTLVEDGAIEPIIAARLPLHDAARAHEMIASGTVRGKIVLMT